jgi:hypothetical protein
MNGRCLVARQIVHNDHVAAAEFGQEDSGHIGEERIGIHRSVEHPGRDHSAASQAGYEGGGFPMVKGDAGTQSLASTATTIVPGQVAGRPSFIDEDEPVRIESENAARKNAQ